MFGLPEAHVVSLVGAVTDGLFKRQILFPALEEQRADRCIEVRPIEHHAQSDVDGGSQGYLVGRIPAGRGEGADHLFLGANEADVDRVAGNILLGGGDHGAKIVNPAPVVKDPELRQQEIADQQIGDQHNRQRRSEMHEFPATGHLRSP